MDQGTRWLTRYQEVVEFVETNHRNPSRHRIEEHDMLNWVKANRKALNAGKMRPERMKTFVRLMAERCVWRILLKGQLNYVKYSF